jgi:hypothetical protein
MILITMMCELSNRSKNKEIALLLYTHCCALKAVYKKTALSLYFLADFNNWHTQKLSHNFNFQD